MTEKERPEYGPEYPPGSPEDLLLMTQVLNQFFASKLRATELWQRGVTDEMMASTGSTKSICHVDGKDDGDDGKIPDV